MNLLEGVLRKGARVRQQNRERLIQAYPVPVAMEDGGRSATVRPGAQSAHLQGVSSRFVAIMTLRRRLNGGLWLSMRLNQLAAILSPPPLTGNRPQPGT